jgi:hypothetical protein
LALSKVMTDENGPYVALDKYGSRRQRGLGRAPAFRMALSSRLYVVDVFAPVARAISSGL